MRDVTAVKLASYKLDTAPPREEIEALLNPLVEEKTAAGQTLPAR